MVGRIKKKCVVKEGGEKKTTTSKIYRRPCNICSSLGSGEVREEPGVATW